MRALIVGAGSLAVGHYLPALTARDDLDVAVVSRSPQRAREAADRFGARALTSWSEVAAFGPDLAFNVTTDTQHAAVLDELIGRAVPRILTEKPLVSAAGQERVDESDFADGLRLARRASDAGVEIGLGFNYRFFETSRRSLDALSSGALGPVRSVVADMHHACLSHTIDLVHAAAGPIETLSAQEVAAPGGLPATRAVAFATAAAAAGTFTISSARSWEDRLFSITALTERGRIAWSDLDAEAESFDDATGYRTTTTLGGGRSRWDRYAASFRASIAAFLVSSAEGAPAPVPLEAGLRELQVEAAIVRAVRERRPVRVQEEFPLPG